MRLTRFFFVVVFLLFFFLQRTFKRNRENIQNLAIRGKDEMKILLTPKIYYHFSIAASKQSLYTWEFS